MSSGAGAEQLRTATAARRQVVARLAGVATEALRESGRSPDAHLEEVRGTLEAASVDTAVGKQLLEGTLERSVQEAGGFGDMVGLQLVPDDEAETPAGRGRKGGPSKPTVTKADQGKLRRDAAAAERKARLARERADRLADQVKTSKDRLAELEAKHAEAESAALEAELEAKRAGEALRGT